METKTLYWNVVTPGIQAPITVMMPVSFVLIQVIWFDSYFKVIFLLYFCPIVFFYHKTSISKPVLALKIMHTGFNRSGVEMLALT